MTILLLAELFNFNVLKLLNCYLFSEVFIIFVNNIFIFVSGPQWKLLEFPVIVLSIKVLIIITSQALFVVIADLWLGNPTLNSLEVTKVLNFTFSAGHEINYIFRFTVDLLHCLSNVVKTFNYISTWIYETGSANILRFLSTSRSQITRGTQRQFSENICSKDDLRSRIFGTCIWCKISCLPASPRIFEHLETTIIAHF